MRRLGGVAGAGQAPMRRSSLGWPFSHAASCCAGLRDALDRADEGHEVGLTNDLQLTPYMMMSGGTADRGLVERCQGGAAIWLAQRARVQDILGQDVVDEGRTAQLRRQVEARDAASHHAIGRSGLHRCGPGRHLGKVDLAGDGPVVLPGRRTVLQELPVDHGEIVAAAVETQGSALQRLGPHLGADQTHRAARYFDRERRRRIELVRAVGGVARQHDDTIEGQVELLGGDLADGGDDALPHLDLAGGDAHGAIGLEMDPAVEPRIVDQAGRQWARVHAWPPLRRVAAARSTARRMR
jgi:hypothetical protein